MSRCRILRLAGPFKDITEWKCDAIATSANAGLCGNLTPSYWRFRQSPSSFTVGIRHVASQDTRAYPNVDGALHKVAGSQLREALAALVERRGTVVLPLPSEGQGRSWRGSLLPSSTNGEVACLTGAAVSTPAFGELQASIVIHAVAPDGLFTRGPKGEAAALLRQCFASCLAITEEHGLQSVAIPSLGCGVNRWRPSAAAHEAIEAVADWAQHCSSRSGDSSSALERVDFVLQNPEVWGEWRRRITQRFGEPSVPDDEGTLSWQIGD